jgi:hypothetical protein
MTTDDLTPRDIAPKFTFREWTKAVTGMENQLKYHAQRMDSAKLPLLQAYHWEQSELCKRVLRELKRAQVEGG